MSVMVDRVAAAIEAASHEHTDWKGIARAAILAMRQPTRPMLGAAAAALSPGKRPTPQRVGVRRKHELRYYAMIDKALEGEK